ncbi:MAG: LuxR C-terminal-related transcriptional regulator, partial [Bacteroidota bacterium]
TEQSPVKGSVRQLKNRIKDKIEVQRNWDLFKLRFEQVHQDFFAKLRSEYPYLTPGDLRICALLKLNLSSKDIAGMLNISASSVDMARYRIRKKLKLRRKDSLVDFLIEY